jgi:hypothetical protein
MDEFCIQNAIDDGKEQLHRHVAAVLVGNKAGKAVRNIMGGLKKIT